MEKKPVVAFICVHNSCRSQIAEALGKKLAGEAFISVSAGTATKKEIDPGAVAMMKKLHGIDMSKSQYPKTIEHIPEPDLAISMGCKVSCPFIGRPFDLDWGLSDPSGGSEEDYAAVIKAIEEKILELKEELEKRL